MTGWRHSNKIRISEPAESHPCMSAMPASGILNFRHVVCLLGRTSKSEYEAYFGIGFATRTIYCSLAIKVRLMGQSDPYDASGT